MYLWGQYQADYHCLSLDQWSPTLLNWQQNMTHVKCYQFISNVIHQFMHSMHTCCEMCKHARTWVRCNSIAARNNINTTLQSALSASVTYIKGGHWQFKQICYTTDDYLNVRPSVARLQMTTWMWDPLLLHYRWQLECETLCCYTTDDYLNVRPSVATLQMTTWMWDLLLLD